MPTMYLDTETRSRVDLKKSNVYRYVECPDFRILMMSYCVADGPLWTVFDPAEMREMVFQPNIDRIVAHNSQFDRITLNTYLGTDIPLELWDDTQPRAGEHGYPQGLDMLAKALGATPKDTAGTRLINFFSKPQRDGTFNQPEDHPEKWADFVRYCEQDVDTLREVDQLLPGWPTPAEREAWLVDQRINERGFRIDVDLASKAIEVAEDNRMVQELEVMKLTGVSNPGSQQQLLPWLQANSQAPVPNLKAETIEEALEAEPDGTVAHRVLELRQELAMSAFKKYTAAVNSVNQDARLRGGFRFFGAHTGRWSGSGMQPHNLPREQLEDEDATDAAILDLKMGAGVDAITLKALVRALLVGPLTVVDYAAIEARVIAWLAGEEWALEAFRAGRDIYVETAERMGGLTRSQGKVAVLALGYNGGVRSLRVMGGSGLGTDEELQLMVQQWRRANPHITRFWKELERAFIQGGPVGEHVSVERDGKDRAVVLPSGRAIVYHKCSRRRETVVNQQTGEEYEKTVLSFVNPRGVGRVPTYGGKLSENVTQAVARDILSNALINLDTEGYETVAHVHDEIIVQGQHSVEEVTEIMCRTPDWAVGLPINGEGFVCRRYRKG